MKKSVLIATLMMPLLCISAEQEVLDYFHLRKGPAQTFELSRDWFDCGDLDYSDSIASKVHCLESFRYYQQDTFAILDYRQVTPDRLTLYVDFSQSNYSQMLLNLRRDGYQLVRATRSGKTFDVIERSLQSPSDEVDKAIVQFLNDGGATIETQMMWKLESNDKQSTASFRSDGQQIELSFVIEQ